MAQFSDFISGKLASRITTSTTTGVTVTAQQINGDPITFPTGEFYLYIVRKTRTGVDVEKVLVASGTSQSGATVTLGTLTRGLSLSDGTDTTGSAGNKRSFPANADVYLSWGSHQADNTAFKNEANTFTTHQTISSTNELRFADSATAIWDDGSDINFKSSAQATRTLTQLASLSGANDKFKISANDTTENYAVSKITGGDGITVTETDDAGNETLDIDVQLATDPGLEINSGALRVKASTGITRDSNGISVNQSALTSVPKKVDPVYLGHSDSAANTATSATAFDTHSYTISANDLINGVSYEVEATANISAMGANDVIFSIFLGGTALVSTTGQGTTTTGSVYIRAIIWGTAAAGAAASVRGGITASLPNGEVGVGEGAANRATNGSLALALGAHFGTSGSVVLKNMTVKKISTTAF